MEQPYESPAFSNSWQIYGDSPRLDPSTVFSLWCHHGTDSLGVSCEYNNIRVLEYPFSNEPKVLTLHTQEQLTSKHAILTCTDLSSLFPHTHTQACMHACACTNTHLFEAGRKQKEVLGVEKRWILSCDFKEDKVLSMSHREMKVPDGGTTKEKACCLWNLLHMFGIQNTQLLAEEQRVHDDRYSSRSER